MYRELWPDVQIVGHRETRSDIIERTYGVRAKTLSDMLAAQTQQQVTLQDWKTTLAGDDPRKQRAFDGFVVQPAVERMWRQARGEPDK